MFISKLMKSSGLFVVNQHGSCHLSIIIELAGRGRPGAGLSTVTDDHTIKTPLFVSTAPWKNVIT